MLLVPFDRGLQPLFECHLWRPSQLPETTAIDGVASVMSWAILDESQEALGLAQNGEDLFCDLDIFPFVTAPDVIDRARLTVHQHMLDGGAVIVHRQPIAAVAPTSIERQAGDLQAHWSQRAG